MKPEYRLKPLPLGAILLPAGFFLYGWTAQYKVHWIVPILGHLIMYLTPLLSAPLLPVKLLPFAIY